MKKSLVVGLGIGQLYVSVLKSLGHEVTTVDSDPSKRADHRELTPRVLLQRYDTVHICTPNFTHESLARTLAYSPMLFVEKPGFSSAARWREFSRRYPKTRAMMVKNNQWRSNIQEMRELASRSKKITINWINRDRVPNPGSWFTTQELAWGGVSRDLLPHLLSIFLSLDERWLSQAQVVGKNFQQRWQLGDISNSDYGKVNPSGVYNVDDYANLEIQVPGVDVSITADWRSNVADDISIKFLLEDGTQQVIPLGLCPEEAYQTMIRTALEHKDDDNFWNHQFEHDCWIHQQVEKA